MDYSKVPLRRRTRLQKALFYREFNEEKKKKKREAESGGDGGSGGGGSGGNRESVSGGRARVEGGGLNLGFGGSGSDVGGQVESNGGVGSGSFEKGESLGTEEVRRFKKGTKKNQNVVAIDGDSKKISKNKKGVKKDKNVVKASVDSKKNIKSSTGLEKKKNVMGMGVDDDDEEAEEKEDDYDYDYDYDYDDDEEEEEEDDDYEDEIEFLGMKNKGGRVIEVNEAAEDGVEVCKCKNCGAEVVSSSQKREKSTSVRLNDGKSCGVSSQVQSQLEEAIGVVSTDSEELSESHDVSESKGNAIRKTGIVEGDLKRERGRQRKVAKLGQLSPCGLDDEGEDGSGRVDGEGKERSVESGLKRTRICGLDILVDCEKEEGEEETQAPKTVGERVRMRRVSQSTKSKKKKQEIGTFSCPFTLIDEELDSSSSDEDGTDNDDDAMTGFKSCNDGRYVWKADEKGKGKVGTPAKRTRNAVYSAAPISIDKILADSIWEKGDVPLENLVSSKDKVPDQEATLPLKFRFEDKDTEPPEKSYWEIEADKLFTEMDFVLAACEIGSSDSAMVDDKDSITQETESDPAACCHQGKHQLVLDEQIGLKCRICSFVKLEIKHILPSFGKRPWGRAYKKGLGSTDHFNLDELQFQGSASVSGSKQPAHAKGTVWDIIPGIKDSMYAHQREGFEFIWKNIAGGIDLEELKKMHAFDGGGGCIISHAPGTGKTRLTLVFLQTYMELYQTCRPVIIAPSSMLLTWEEEFRKWKVDIPFHNMNKLKFSGQENAVAVSLVKQLGSRGQNENSIRLAKLYSWKMYRSVLGISYTLFEQLVGDGVFRKMLLELPGLLVLDEGHTPRNDQSQIWKALSGVETQKRIILSGTPFQNNFRELFNTLCLVRPKFTDKIFPETHRHSGKKRGRKSSVARGKWDSLTSSIGKDADDKLDKLRDMIDPFVHVHKGSILKESLPGLRDSMVVLQPTHLEKVLIKVIQGRKNHLELYHLVSLISVNPSLLLKRLSEEEELSIHTDNLERLRLHPQEGVKTKFLMELIRLSEPLKEKVLVFSQYTVPLTFLSEHLKSHFDWTEGKELLYMDGKCDAKQRQHSISLLNDPASEVRVLLASTKACCEGINLVGASRVVLLDVVWNPSVERQAISRAYRIGQKKIVYIYHLITAGTMEGEKYVRQAEKDRLSELVFSSADGGVRRSEISCTVTEDKILQEMVQHEKLSHMFEKILNQPKESNLIDTFGLVDL